MEFFSLIYRFTFCEQVVVLCLFENRFASMFSRKLRMPYKLCDTRERVRPLMRSAMTFARQTHWMRPLNSFAVVTHRDQKFRNSHLHNETILKFYFLCLTKLRNVFS